MATSEKKKATKAIQNARTNAIKKARGEEIRQKLLAHIQKQGFDLPLDRVYLHPESHAAPYVWKTSGGYSITGYRGFSDLNTYQRSCLLEALDSGKLVAVRNPDLASVSPSIELHGFQDEDDHKDKKMKKEEIDDGHETANNAHSASPSPAPRSANNRAKAARTQRYTSRSIRHPSASPPASTCTTPAPSTASARPATRLPFSATTKNNPDSTDRIVAAPRGNRQATPPHRTASIATQTPPATSASKRKADTSTNDTEELKASLRAEYRRRLHQDMMEALGDRNVDLHMNKRRREELKEWFDDGMRMLREMDSEA
ncbi:hypothetical protein BJ508DRAFT_419028 [Ascobolus immersus RN42]|uniref:Uncharacterized protein n=1 Tax=Ascobolus immersus RN42 TaxID=1160509 RepID=A0A3N4HJG9_ASCIM|nr:hypothetical protein BJ508DRAFT_419028 [Ascobolus immersus RN42]